MKRFMFFAIIIAFVVIVGASAAAQTDSLFNYQGELKQNGGPANGSYNVDFSLWDAASSGNQIGATVMNNGVQAVDGRFTVELDFGADAFDNADRWLEISVNGNELAPRQPIARAPYSIQTRGIFVDENKNVGIGTTQPLADFHIQPKAIPGDVRIGSPASSPGIASFANNGNRRDIRFTDFGIGLFTRNSPSTPVHGNGLFINESGHVGIGSTTPQHPLEVASSSNGGIDVCTTGAGSNGDGIVVKCSGDDAYAVWAIATPPASLAGLFNGDVDVNGTFTKSGGSFKIDHPLDPANKFLSHSFVESPDMMNIYNGNITTDGRGYATIQLPDWFETLNRDFRYQLTVVDDNDSNSFVLAKVVQRIRNNRFKIRTSAAFTEISWQVTGVRHDAWAEANRIPVEEQKVGFEAGHYLHPEVYDLDRSMSVLAARKAFRESFLSESEVMEKIQR